MKSGIYISILLLIFPAVLFAQHMAVMDTADNLIVYSNERTAHFTAYSEGLGLGYRTGKNINVFNTRILTFDLANLTSSKQIKVINPYYANSKRYVYGKLNDIFLFRAGYGHDYLLNRKPYWGGIELRWLWQVGLTAAIEKPYYLFVIKLNQSTQGGLNYIIDTQKFDDDVSWDDIYGRAPFTKGLNELKVVPGLFGRFGFNFEFGNIKTSIKAVEAGTVVSFFPQGLNMMDDERNQRLFLNFYISYLIGKRFNKY